MDDIKQLLVDVFEWSLGLVLNMPTQTAEILEQNQDINFSIADDVAVGVLPIGISLMVLFFIIEFTSKCINPDWITYQNVTMFILKGMIFKQILTYSSDLLTRVYRVTQRVFASISSNVNEITPADIEAIVEQIMGIEGGIQGILLIVAYFLVIGILSLIILGSLIYVRVIIYGILIEILIHKALAPLVMSTLVSDSVSSMGKRFLQSYAAVCLQASIILLSSLIFSSLMPSIMEFGDEAIQNEWVALIGFCTVVICYVLTLSKSGAISKTILGL